MVYLTYWFFHSFSTRHIQFDRVEYFKRALNEEMCLLDATDIVQNIVADHIVQRKTT